MERALSQSEKQLTLRKTKNKLHKQCDVAVLPRLYTTLREEAQRRNFRHSQVFDLSDLGNITPINDQEEKENKNRNNFMDFV